MPDEKAPESLKVRLHHPRRLRAYMNPRLERYEVDDVVELRTREALELCDGGLASPAPSDEKAAKGTPLTGDGSDEPKRKAAKKAVAKKADEATDGD